MLITVTCNSSEMFIILVLLNILQKLMTLIIILHSEIISCDGNNILSVLKIQILIT